MTLHQNNWFTLNLTKVLLKNIHNNTLDYNSFITGNLMMLKKHPVRGALDFKAVDVMSYSEWILNLNSFQTVKIEGFESNKYLRAAIKPILEQVKDVHVFKTNQTGFSFKWHKDDVDVKLLVLKGTKTIYIRGAKYILKAGQYVDIPKGHLHRAFSLKNTIALSIGMK